MPILKYTLVFSLCLLLALTAVLPAAAQGGGPIYVIEAGDTLSGIAATFGTTVQALMQANGLSQAASIQPGQTLTIPGFTDVEGVLTVHPVAFGDTINSLARQRGLPAAALARLNRALHPDSLYLGQGLILTEAAEAAPSRQRRLAQPAAGRMALAAAAGVNPYQIEPEIGGGLRLWTVAGEVLWLPDEAEVPAALAAPLPLTSVSITPIRPEQGQTVVVRLQATETAELSGALADWPLHFNQDEGGDWIALQGVDALLDPGVYPISIEVGGSDGSAFGANLGLPVRSGDYGFDPILTVPPETLDPANIELEEAQFSSLLQAVTERRWAGAFAYPSNYFVESFPSVFGTRRNYNGTGYNAYHTGLDFYGGTGVEILAPAPGTVVFADMLTVRGLTTVIDHGWGVYSVYMHQSEVVVTDGDQVETGQVIGLVGATGRATGPHLHWEIRVGGVPVQPLDWVNQAFP